MELKAIWKRGLTKY